MNDAPLSKPRIARHYRLQWEPVQDCHVLLYPEGMVQLNRSAAEILMRCDGTRSAAAIVAELETAFATTGLADDVAHFLAHARDQHWIEHA